MGGGGGPRGPSAAETRKMMGGHWEQYQQWGTDAQSSFAKKEAGIKSRMAAGGVKAGSAQWTTNLAKAKSDYEKNIKGVKTGATAGIMKDWVAEQKKDIVVGGGTSKQIDSRPDWYSEELASRTGAVTKPEHMYEKKIPFQFEGQPEGPQLTAEGAAYEKQVADTESALVKEVQGMSTEDYLTREFGVAKQASAADPAEPGTGEGARAGRRRQTGSAATASPWW